MYLDVKIAESKLNSLCIGLLNRIKNGTKIVYNRPLSSSYNVIVRLSVVLKTTVVCD